ncbi:collagen alpha-1(I) chain-like [Pithys albifrons albifrons]|uniref:collagen alpha-1(I) chain-like n=1 Tax=Pithys albifrons albifrons TaxID=3385563 RepID=UPI003A5D039C
MGTLPSRAKAPLTPQPPGSGRGPPKELPAVPHSGEAASAGGRCQQALAGSELRSDSRHRCPCFNSSAMEPGRPGGGGGGSAAPGVTWTAASPARPGRGSGDRGDPPLPTGEGRPGLPNAPTRGQSPLPAPHISPDSPHPPRPPGSPRPPERGRLRSAASAGRREPPVFYAARGPGSPPQTSSPHKTRAKLGGAAAPDLLRPCPGPAGGTAGHRSRALEHWAVYRGWAPEPGTRAGHRSLAPGLGTKTGQRDRAPEPCTETRHRSFATKPFTGTVHQNLPPELCAGAALRSSAPGPRTGCGAALRSRALPEPPRGSRIFHGAGRAPGKQKSRELKAARSPGRGAGTPWHSRPGSRCRRPPRSPRPPATPAFAPPVPPLAGDGTRAAHRPPTTPRSPRLAPPSSGQGPPRLFLGRNESREDARDGAVGRCSAARRRAASAGARPRVEGLRGLGGAWRIHSPARSRLLATCGSGAGPGTLGLRWSHSPFEAPLRPGLTPNRPGLSPKSAGLQRAAPATSPGRKPAAPSPQPRRGPGAGRLPRGTGPRGRGERHRAEPGPRPCPSPWPSGGDEPRWRGRSIDRCPLSCPGGRSAPPRRTAPHRAPRPGAPAGTGTGHRVRGTAPGTRKGSGHGTGTGYRERQRAQALAPRQSSSAPTGTGSVNRHRSSWGPVGTGTENRYRHRHRHLARAPGVPTGTSIGTGTGTGVGHRAQAPSGTGTGNRYKHRAPRLEPVGFAGPPPRNAALAAATAHLAQATGTAARASPGHRAPSSHPGGPQRCRRRCTEPGRGSGSLYWRGGDAASPVPGGTPVGQSRVISALPPAGRALGRRERRRHRRGGLGPVPPVPPVPPGAPGAEGKRRRRRSQH